METLIGTGAESQIILEDNQIIKRRIAKGYRLPELDEKIRKRRTRAEAKIMAKLEDKINVPKIINVNENKKEIVMDYIRGKKLADNLDSFTLQKQEEICRQIGEEVSKIHNEELIHGDLTTSNMILKDDKVFFIDFGLGFHSNRIEDKAVDLHLFKQALESKHFKHAETLFKNFLQEYNPKDKEEILKKFKEVELRGRHKH